MPSQRKSKRRGQPLHRPLDMNRLASVPRVATRGGIEYHVQRLSGGSGRGAVSGAGYGSGSSGGKTYVCPGCGHIVNGNSPHVVAWPLDAPFGVDQGVGARRHWHGHCWDSGVSAVY